MICDSFAKPNSRLITKLSAVSARLCRYVKAPNNSARYIDSSSFQSQKPGKALDLTTQLQVPESIDVAIKLAVKAKVAFDAII